MAARSISETKRARYLLGLSSPAEREHIESEYFEDEDAFQEMLTAEDDLIDAYAHGELAGEERRRFEKSFLNSGRGRDRVQFARAFAGAISATQTVETKPYNTFLDSFKTFRSPGLLQTATIAAVIVLVAVLAWLVIDFRRMTNELRELRAESAALLKRTEALQRSTDTERTRTAEITAMLPERRAQSEKPRNRERGTTANQGVRHLPEVKNDRKKIASSKPEPEEKIISIQNSLFPGPSVARQLTDVRKNAASSKPIQAEKLINTQDATLGNTFEIRKITELPLDVRNVAGLLSLQSGGRADQSNLTLNGVEPLNIYSLIPRNTNNSGEITIFISSSLTWIRFQLALETAAIREDYRITINTADGRPVTSVDWSEPLTPNQTVIDTPAISTRDLPSGDYILLLMGKEPDGSFIKVSEYSFKIYKY